MKTILLVSELGEGLGHVAPLLIIANAIQAKAADPLRLVFAVKDAIGARSAFKDSGFPFLPAPTVKTSAFSISNTASYIEILGHIGFTRQNVLDSAVATWDNLYELVSPDLIIAEHSPTACLAARGRYPTLQVGSGYTMPPAQSAEFPALKAGMAVPPVHALILDHVNRVLKTRKVNRLEHLPQMLASEQRAVFTIPQFDPYHGLRKEAVLGTYNEKISFAALPERPHIFLYAGAVAEQLDTMAQAVADTGVTVSAYLGSQETPAKHYLKSMGARVHDTPPHLCDVLAEASIVVSHGGAGLSTAATLMGRPQVVLPIHNESLLTAGRVEHYGLGLVIEKGDENNLPAALDAVLNVRRFAETAQETGQALAASGLPGDPVDQVAGVALAML